MKNKYSVLLLLSISVALTLSSCKSSTSPPTTFGASAQDTLLKSMATSVIVPNYLDIDAKVAMLGIDISVLGDSTQRTDANLAICRKDWVAARTAWESNEGFLIGPVESLNIDPNTDTWPVFSSDLDSVSNSQTTFTQQDLDSLEQDLKGFHAIEYLIYGDSGSRTAAQLTSRDIAYLLALVQNLEGNYNLLVQNWDTTNSSSYYYQFITAGAGSTVYPTRRAAFQDIANTMAGICEEVGTGAPGDPGKLTVPFTQDAPQLQESPFSNTSIQDFIHNIQGVQNIYLGNYGTSHGEGMSTLVRANDLSLDGEIQSKINAAIAALQAITDNFTQAITEQPTQIRNAITAIAALHDEIEGKLVPFINQYTN
jgi:putative iron-regulated protein